MYVSPINEIVRLQQNLKAAGQQKRGRHPVFNANMFYPRKLENELNDLLRAELERIFLENMAFALNGLGLRDDVAEMNAAPVVLSSGFLEKSKNFAERVNANAGDTYQKQVELIIGRPYYPPTAQREILEAWHDEFQALCISAGQDGKKKIAMTVAVAKEKGWNKKQTEEAIRALLPAETKHRAELIARTETGKLNSRCVRETYAQTGIKYYKWLTTIDGRERENHAAMNGQICDVNDPDVIYEENPENPLRPIQKKKTGEMVHLHPGQDFQCRCTMVMWEPEIDGKYEVTEEHEREEAERLAAEEKANNEAEAARLAELERQRLEREAEEERKRKEAEAAYIAEVERKAKERARKRVAAAIKKAQESNRALQILQAANARHAKRTEAERQDIIGRWNERRRKREIMAIAERRHANRSAAQAAAILKEVQARIDARNKLRGLLAELKGISGINTASATTAIKKAKLKNIETAISKMEAYKAEIMALEKYIENPLEACRKYGLEEIKGVYNSIENKFTQWAGLPDWKLLNKYEFEANFVEQHKKYKTWQIAQKAYLKAYNDLKLKVEIEKLKPDLEDIKKYKSKAKNFVAALNKAETKLANAKTLQEVEEAKKAIEAAVKIREEAEAKKMAKKIGGTITQAQRNAGFWAKDGIDYYNEFIENTGKTWNKLSVKERGALYYYTHTYCNINEPLRGITYVGAASKAKEGLKNIPYLTSAIDKFSIEKDLWLQRGDSNINTIFHRFGVDISGMTEKEAQAALLGKEGIEKAFLSCGSSKGKGFSGSVITNIFVPKGTKGAYVEPISRYGNGSDYDKWDGSKKQNSVSHENETLLQRGTKFRVTKVEKSGGQWYIDVDVIGQEPQSY